MARIYIIICIIAISLGYNVLKCEVALAESIFGDEGVFDDEKKREPDENGKLYLRGSKAWQEQVIKNRDKFIKDEWQRRLPGIEAEYRAKFGPPLSERNK